MSKPILFPDATYLELSMPGEFQRFYQEYIGLLERKLQRITLGGTDQFYFLPAARFMTAAIIIGTHFITCGRMPAKRGWIFTA